MSELTPLQRAVVAIKELRARLDAKESAENEPIAIVGMACRFPGGADTPAAFWQLLRDGVDAITPIPANRWHVDAHYDPDPDAAGKMAVREGGYLHNIDQFDPQFFGISPREAQRLDPQQRLLLMVAWEALENASIPRGTIPNTGVFVGIGQNDYAQRQLFAGDPTQIDAYDGTGNGFCFAAGRLSHVLGLQGPNLALDTACSSSLVALHLACQSLRNGECDAALAGGVQLSLSPEIGIFLSKARALAPDGRCKTFDASANGFSRGEGCGVVVLKRLSVAVAAGDRVLALVRGSAVNHDGTSSGITVPNGIAQANLLRQALAKARLQPDDIDYIEAHGTGTALGDPIEIEALAELYGSRQRRLPIGSVKTNVGHLEAAAGVAGLLKVILSLQHQALPRHLHFDTPNPRIAWDSLPFDVVSSHTPWRQADRPLRAGISSFGISGTNAHVIIEQATPIAETQATAPDWHVLPLSAQSPAALQQLQQRFAAHAIDRVGDVSYTAATGRSHHEWRLAISADSPQSLQQQLQRPISPHRSRRALRIAFLFTGQGSQYAAMGADLYPREPVFRAALDECNAHFKTATQRNLPLSCYGATSETTIHATANTQPALFALGYALATLWQAWGVMPSVVLGHSVGELAAACVAGAISVADGIRLAIERGRLMQALPQNGAMLACRATAAQVEPYLNGRVSLAALNAPNRIVLSGDRDILDAIADDLATQGIAPKRLQTSHAFHSSLMQPMIHQFAEVAQSVTYREPHTRFVSTVTGQQVGAFSAEYWRKHILAPVNFAAAIAHAATLDIDAYVEIGPAPTLCALGQQNLPDGDARWLPSLRANTNDRQQISNTLGELYTLGAAIDWPAVYAQRGYRRVTLPTYPFQTQSYLIPSPQPHAASPTGILGDIHAGKEARVLAQLVQSGRFSAEQLALLPDMVATLTQMAQGESADFSDKLYELRWQPFDPSTTLASLDAPWLILPEPSGMAAAFAAYLETNDIAHTLHADTLPDQAALNGKRTIAFAPTPHDLLHLAQTAAGADTTLWVVTQNAVALASEAVQAEQAAVWGMGRTLALEIASQWGGLIDWDAADPAVLHRALQNASGETQIAVRTNRCHVPRIARAAFTPQPVAIHAGATYLVTGGTGALGLRLARWLVEQGARQLLLTSRRGITNNQQAAAIADLQLQGAAVDVAQVDVADEAQMRPLFAKLAESAHPLRGIVHAAGLAGVTLLADLRADELNATLRPKLTGGHLLDSLSREFELDFFVLFSSIAAAWGSKSQAHYAAANAALDGLAQERRRLGLPALSINWGAWADGGMVSAENQTQLQRNGINLLEPSVGIAAFAHLLGAAQSQLIVADVDWLRFYPLYQLTPQRTLLANFAPKVDTLDADGATPFAQLLAATDTQDRYETLLAFLQGEVAQILGFVNVDSAERDRGFADMGFDSLMAVELKTRLQNGLGKTLPATIAFDYPTIDALGAFVAADVLGWGAESDSVQAETVAAVDSAELDDAIDDQLAQLEKLLGGLG